MHCQCHRGLLLDCLRARSSTINTIFWCFSAIKAGALRLSTCGSRACSRVQSEPTLMAAACGDAMSTKSPRRRNYIGFREVKQSPARTTGNCG